MLLVTLADAFPVNVVTLLGESVAVSLPADTGIGACSARLLSGSVTTGTTDGEENPARLNVRASGEEFWLMATTANLLVRGSLKAVHVDALVGFEVASIRR